MGVSWVLEAIPSPIAQVKTTARNRAKAQEVYRVMVNDGFDSELNMIETIKRATFPCLERVLDCQIDPCCLEIVE